MSTWTLTSDDGTTTSAWDIIPALRGSDGVSGLRRRRERYVACSPLEYDGDDRTVRVIANNGEDLIFGFDVEQDDDHTTIVGWTYSCYNDDEECPWTTDGDPIEAPGDIDTRVIATIRQWAAARAARMDDDI